MLREQDPTRSPPPKRPKTAAMKTVVTKPGATKLLTRKSRTPSGNIRLRYPLSYDKSSTSGATRVFTVIDLLEKILLHAMEQLDYNRSTEFYSASLVLAKFITSLIILERLNRTFRDTIKGSTSIQAKRLESSYCPAKFQSLFEPSESTKGNRNIVLPIRRKSAIATAEIGPVLWLTRAAMGVLLKGVARSTDNGTNLVTVEFEIERLLAFESWEMRERPEASWRKVPCDLFGAHLRVLVYVPWFDVVVGEPSVRAQLLSRGLDSGATLGDLVELLLEAMKEWDAVERMREAAVAESRVRWWFTLRVGYLG